MRSKNGRGAGVDLPGRISGWAQERILGGSLYKYEQPSVGYPMLFLNGVKVDIVMEKGYAVIDREWKKGDTIELALPMPVRKVVCDPRVADNRGKAALQRGPLVYCVEGRDTEPAMDAITLGKESGLTPQSEPGLPGGIVAVRGPGFTAVPYYAWANRGPDRMRVWLRNGKGTSS